MWLSNMGENQSLRKNQYTLYGTNCELRIACNVVRNILSDYQVYILRSISSNQQCLVERHDKMIIFELTIIRTITHNRPYISHVAFATITHNIFSKFATKHKQFL